ncbi:hypothetical protein WA158_007984 [Blastocystis sp. Blastoise]
MPPSKKAQQKAQDKALQKKAEKIVEDKTFGLKNKNKSKKVQEYVQNVKKVYTGKDDKTLELKKQQQKKEKEEKKKAEKEAAELFKAIVTMPKLAFGEDPKSVLCPFFKQGFCAKGAKCKFSHDLSKVARSSAKKDIHTDIRDEKKTDNMANWTQEQLEAVVKQNAAKYTQTNQTSIVCRYFLDAIEQEIYGWFWQCPNGPNCKYRHALPEGYVYKSKAEREAEGILKDKDRATDKNLLKLENIELLRSRLPSTGLTPVTPESFAKWKEERRLKKQAEKEKADTEAQKKKSSGKEFRLLSGRALFVYNPEVFVDDADALDNNDYEQEEPIIEDTQDANFSNYHEEETLPEGQETEIHMVTSAEVFAEENLDDLDDIDIDDDDDDEDEENTNNKDNTIDIDKEENQSTEETEKNEQIKEETQSTEEETTA